MDTRAHDERLDVRVWRPALEKFGAVTHLTATLYDAHERAVCCDTVQPRSLAALFEEYHYTPAIRLDCARECLSEAADRPTVIVAASYGLAVVGTPLVLDGTIVGAAVAGYALMEFCQSTTIAALARQAGVPFRPLWELAQQQQPIPEHRLRLHGELLQVLGDTILREHHRTRQYEEAAERLQAEVAVKDEFLAVLSHELRTPLTPILGWVRILEDTSGDDPVRLKAAQSIKRNALLQIKLVDDLLDLNGVVRDKIALDLAAHDLSDVLRAALETLEGTAAAKQIALEFVEPDAPATVLGDAARLQQVFGNVLSNAIKFTPPHGRVRISAVRSASVATVRITDTGQGIPSHFVPRVFEIFRQHEEGTRRRHSGLGIGLAVVKGLVELHGGDVSIASGGAGLGTEVTINLPLLQHDETMRRAGMRAEDNHPFTNLSVLLVEDTEDTLEATRTMLEMLGATVLAARNGLEALDVMRSHSPDVILCDLRMPKMDGFEFLQELSRLRSHHPPVVAVTGFVSQGDRNKTLKAGFEGHLNKPFDDAALIATVEATLQHHRSA